MKPAETVALHDAFDGVAVITLNRPERRNALNLDIKMRIAEAILALEADSSVRVIILTGAGGYFIAGTDIAEMEPMSPAQHQALVTDRMFTVLRRCPKILIAAVEGYALGGGCETALCCDMIVAGERARFGQPEIRVGIMPGAGGTQRLLRAIGKYRTMKLVLTGDTLTASEAFQAGLLSEIVPDGSALDRALAIAKNVAAMPPLAVQAIKEVVQMGQDAPLETALFLERKTFVQLFDTQDQKEGMRAFLEKRPPQFKGK
jgi:enoyl-CoA hydratase